MQNGDLKLYKWFVGQVMGRTKGMADPNTLNQVLSKSFGYNSYDEMASAIEASDNSKSSNKGGKKKKSVR